MKTTRSGFEATSKKEDAVPAVTAAAETTSSIYDFEMASKTFQFALATESVP